MKAVAENKKIEIKMPNLSPQNISRAVGYGIGVVAGTLASVPVNLCRGVAKGAKEAF